MLVSLFLYFLYLFSLYSVGFVLNLTYRIFFFLQAFLKPLVNQVLLLFFKLQCFIGQLRLYKCRNISAKLLYDSFTLYAL